MTILHLVHLDRMKLLLFLLPVACVYGQQTLSLHDAVALGLKQSPALAASAAGTDAAGARTEQAKAGRLPSVLYNESWTRSDNPVFVFGSLLNQRQFAPQNFAIDTLNRPGFLDNFRSVVSVTQTVYDGGVTASRIESARLGQRLAVQQDRQARAETIAAIVRAYAGSVLAEERLKAAELAVRSGEADLAKAESLLNSGMATDMDVLSIRVHLAAVREARIQAAANRNVARASLNDAMGLPLDSEHQLTTGLGMPAGVVAAATSRQQASFEQQARESRPEIQEAQLATGLARSENRLARNARKPTVTFQGAFEADRQQFVQKGGANWLVGVSLNWQVFNGFADRNKVAETVHATRKAVAEEARVDSAVRIHVRRAYADLQAAGERIETARAAVAESEESLRITRNRYQAGLSTVTDLIRTETAVLETSTRYLSALHDQRVTVAALEFAAGVLTLDSEVLQ